MKQILSLLACALCLGCSSRAFTINGSYTAEDGTPVYLIDLEAADTLASATVQQNRFVFSGTVNAPFYAYVGQGRERVRFILEPGTVAVDLDERTESGTPMVDAYNDFHRRFYGAASVEEQVALADSVVRANRDNLVGAMALDDLFLKDTARFRALYDEATEFVRANMLVRDDYTNLQEISRTAPGKKFTDYTVKGGNPDGTDVKLSDYVSKGKYILLDHWASWCGPCKAEMPYIKKTWEAFHGDRFDVVSIAVSDKREDTEKALRSLDMPWNQILDGQRIPVELYNVKTIPHLILFAPDGTILQRGLRGEQIYETIARILGE